MARPIPVLPLVASMTVCPGFNCPECSAASMTPSASRSLTEPKGLNASILTNRFAPGGASLFILTTGVLPTVSRMLPNRRPMRSLPIGRVAGCAFVRSALNVGGRSAARSTQYIGDLASPLGSSTAPACIADRRCRRSDIRTAPSCHGIPSRGPLCSWRNPRRNNMTIANEAAIEAIPNILEKAPLERYVGPDRPTLVGLSRSELAALLGAIGVPPAQRRMRGQQLWHGLYVMGATSFDGMTSLSKELRAELGRRFTLARPEVVAEQVSVDGTRKWLLRLPGENLRPHEVECVYIPEPGRGTLCLSSQVGCT